MRSLFICTVIALAAASTAFITGCTASHTETDHPNLLGGSTHTDTTVIHKN